MAEINNNEAMLSVIEVITLLYNKRVKVPEVIHSYGDLLINIDALSASTKKYIVWLNSPNYNGKDDLVNDLVILFKQRISDLKQELINTDELLDSVQKLFDLDGYFIYKAYQAGYSEEWLNDVYFAFNTSIEIILAQPTLEDAINWTKMILKLTYDKIINILSTLN